MVNKHAKCLIENMKLLRFIKKTSLVVEYIF